MKSAALATDKGTLSLNAPVDGAGAGISHQVITAGRGKMVVHVEKRKQRGNKAKRKERLAKERAIGALKKKTSKPKLKCDTPVTRSPKVKQNKAKKVSSRNERKAHFQINKNEVCKQKSLPKKTPEENLKEQELALSWFNRMTRRKMESAWGDTTK